MDINTLPLSFKKKKLEVVISVHYISMPITSYHLAAMPLQTTAQLFTSPPMEQHFKAWPNA